MAEAKKAQTVAGRGAPFFTSEDAKARYEAAQAEIERRKKAAAKKAAK